MDHQVATLFSGGMDSTLTAMYLADHFARVHLLTYKTLGLIRLNSSAIHAQQLIEKLGPARISHEIIDINELHRRLRTGFAQDYLNYCKGTAPGVLCLGCKLAMHVRTLLYCLEHGVAYATDGALRVQSDHPECMPGVLNTLRQMYADYGVHFSSPMYEIDSKDQNRKRMLELGFTVAKKIGSTTRFDQPICLVGPFSTMWHYSAPYDEAQMVQFLLSKRPVIDSIIADYCQKQQVNLAEIRARAFVVPETEMLQRKETPIQQEFGKKWDLFISTSLKPLWWILDVILKQRAR